MKKAIKKLTAIALLLTLLVGMAAVGAPGTGLLNVFAATSSKCGDNVYWSFDSKTGTMTISGTGAMDDYFSDRTQRPWQDSSIQDNIKKVVVKKGVTYIGSYAFIDCKSLTSVEIASSVKEIDYAAFDNCRSLASVTLPEGLEAIGAYAFAKAKLTSVTIPNSVKNMYMGPTEKQKNRINMLKSRRKYDIIII